MTSIATSGVEQTPVIAFQQGGNDPTTIGPLTPETVAATIEYAATDGFSQEELRSIEALRDGLTPAQLADVVNILDHRGIMDDWMGALDQRGGILGFDYRGLDASEQQALMRDLAAMPDADALEAAWRSIPASEGDWRSSNNLLPMFTDALRVAGDQTARQGFAEYLSGAGLGSNHLYSEALGNVVGALGSVPSLDWVADCLGADGYFSPQDAAVFNARVMATPAARLDAEIAALSDAEIGMWMSRVHESGNLPNHPFAQEIADGITPLFERLGANLDGDAVTRLWRAVPSIGGAQWDVNQQTAAALARGMDGGAGAEQARLEAFIDAFPGTRGGADQLARFNEQLIRSGNAGQLATMLGNLDPAVVAEAAGHDGTGSDFPASYRAGYFLGAAIKAIDSAGAQAVAQNGGGASLLAVSADLAIDFAGLAGREVPFLGTAIGVLIDGLEGVREGQLEARTREQIETLQGLLATQVGSGNDEGPVEDFEEGMLNGFGGL